MGLTDAEDQRFLNTTFSVINNPITGKATVYVEKRPGWGQDSLVVASTNSTGLIKPQAINSTITAFGNTNSTIYVGAISVGAITGRAIYFGETILSGTSYVLIRSSDGTGWYYADGAKDDLTYVGDTHNGTAVLDSIDSTTGMYSGQALSGTGIPAGARILTVDSGTQVTMDANSTADGTDITFTKTPVAKILDADFLTTGSYISGFVEMDGYLFYCADDGNIWNSALNSITSYAAADYKAADMSPDAPVAVARTKNVVIVLGTGSLQGFYNNGYASGSPLERSAQTFRRIGALGQSSVTTLEDDIYFVGSSNYGDVQVWRLREFTPQKVSTPTVDKIIGTQTAGGGAVYVSGFQMGGYPYVMVTLSTTADGPSDKLLLESGDFRLLESGDKVLLEGDPASLASFGRQLVYNAALNIWAEWDCSIATYVVGQGAGGNNNVLATSRFSDSGKVYRINPASDGALYQDDGSTFTAQIRTSKLDHGSDKRKFIREIRLIADTQTAGTVTLECSDDDYVSWSTLGTFDLTETEKKITRCGSHKGGRAYRLSHSYNGPFRAEALEIVYEVGTN